MTDTCMDIGRPHDRCIRVTCVLLCVVSADSVVSMWPCSLHHSKQYMSPTTTEVSLQRDNAASFSCCCNPNRVDLVSHV